VNSGSVQQFVSVLNHSGDTLSTVKYHEGFMGQRIAPVTCIAFHPIQVALFSRAVYLSICWLFAVTLNNASDYWAGLWDRALAGP